MTGHVCLIGLDPIEYGAAIMLVRAGYEVKAVDLRRDVMDRFVKEGGTSASHPADKQGRHLQTKHLASRPHRARQARPLRRLHVARRPQG